MLRDSLGGNCRTVMIAAVAPETQHIEESISTCRFAQRVAMISNQVGGSRYGQGGKLWLAGWLAGWPALSAALSMQPCAGSNRKAQAR